MFKSLLSRAKGQPQVETESPDISRVLSPPSGDSKPMRVVPKTSLNPAAAGREDIQSDGPAPLGTDWLKDDIATLRSAAAMLFDAEHADGAKRDLFLVAHNMRGAAGAYGLPVIERLTGSLCRLLEEDRALAGAEALVNLHVEACRAAANQPDAKASAELADAVCTALEDQVSARIG